MSGATPRRSAEGVTFAARVRARRRYRPALRGSVLLATFRPSVVRAQWRSARGVGWGRVRVLSTLATAAAAGVVHRASRTGPAAGEGFACVLRCRAEAGGDVASP